MAAITFASMVPDISAFLQGCPNASIERTLRKMATDLCQRARVWRYDLADVTLVDGTTEYAPVSPVVYGEVHELVYGKVTVGTSVSELKIVSYDKIRRLYPEWPLNCDGTPKYGATRIPGVLMVAPVPDAAGTISPYAVLRPTATADSWDAAMYREFSRALFHGTLHELMLMPERSWSDPKLAEYHGKQWTFLLNEARDRAERDYNSGSLSVQMRPAA